MHTGISFIPLTSSSIRLRAAGIHGAHHRSRTCELPAQWTAATSRGQVPGTPPCEVETSTSCSRHSIFYPAPDVDHRLIQAPWASGLRLQPEPAARPLLTRCVLKSVTHVLCHPDAYGARKREWHPSRGVSECDARPGSSPRCPSISKTASSTTAPKLARLARCDSSTPSPAVLPCSPARCSKMQPSAAAVDVEDPAGQARPARGLCDAFIDA